MALQFHPEQGTILICDFNGYVEPEMVKRRPVVVISPRLRNRGNLCAVVPLSSTEPRKIEPYHFRLHTTPTLPAPYTNSFHWVKADMVYTVSFSRLALMTHGLKDKQGKRIYDQRIVDKADLLKIQSAVLHGLGLTSLTVHLWG